MPQDELDTLIQDVMHAPPPPAPRPRPQHRVVWFLAGTVLFLFAAIETSILLKFWHLPG